MLLKNCSLSYLEELIFHDPREEDIPVLLSCGKENLYVWECDENMLHENEAADFLCDMCQGLNLRRGKVKEGKLEIFAECDGLLKIDEAGVRLVNSAGEMMIASRHGNFPVKAGDKVTGTCYANSKSLQFQIGDNSEEIFMNYADATRFLKESFISLEDFEEKAAAIKQEDGSIIEGAVLYLEELRIGDDYSENVKVTVKKNRPAAIVVGDQYIREEWGEFTIDKSRNVILYR